MVVRTSPGVKDGPNIRSAPASRIRSASRYDLHNPFEGLAGSSCVNTGFPGICAKNEIQQLDSENE